MCEREREINRDTQRKRKREREVKEIDIWIEKEIKREREKMAKREKVTMLGSDCGSVGTAVASYTRGTQFKSSHRQKFICIQHLYTANCVLKRRK